MAATIFSQEQGRLPASLEELVPAYLPAIPIDATTGKPIGLKIAKDSLIVYAADRPNGESEGLKDLEQPGETRNHVSLAVRIPAPLPAGEPSAKLPNPQP